MAKRACGKRREEGIGNYQQLGKPIIFPQEVRVVARSQKIFKLIITLIIDIISSISLRFKTPTCIDNPAM
ncbi:hypothetical protein [Mesorhizobium sp. M0977]|uniref:hypothetical protein n=1 Tax=Mesorhizobium sp. M0977 TaxID=2957039 RepID=UPI00333D5D5A